jgi:integrase
MATITETRVKAHKAKTRENDGKIVDAYLWDGELKGFGCKATPGGKRAFFVQYRATRNTNIQRVHIGYYGTLTVEQARKEAKRLLGEVAAKRDPAANKRAVKAEREETKAAGTLREALVWFTQVEGQKTRYWRDKTQRLLGNDLKTLHDKPVKKITAPQLQNVLDMVKQRNVSAHSLLFKDLRPFFKWAKKRVPLDINPMAEADAPKAATRRDRTLTRLETKTFWAACDHMAWPWRSMFKLLLLTGSRLEEVAGMRWQELDLDVGMWTLPSKEDFVFERPRLDGTVILEARTKNTRAHTVPLVPTAVAMLDRAAVDAVKADRRFPLDSDFVFSTTGRTPPSGFSRAKNVLDGFMIEELGGSFDWKAMKITKPGKFKAWRLHDLRRTLATGMEDLGIDTRVIEAGLNHVSGSKSGIVGVYQTSQHQDARRRAFLAWEGRLLEIVGDDNPPAAHGDENVLQFRRTA